MIVYAKRGVIIDWNWADELTAWETTGARDDWADAVTARQRLDSRPPNAHQAAAAAHAWWAGLTAQ